MSRMDGKLSIGSAGMTAALCPIVQCSECGDEAMIVGQRGRSNAVACPTCATVVLMHRPAAAERPPEWRAFAPPVGGRGLNYQVRRRCIGGEAGPASSITRSGREAGEAPL